MQIKTSESESIIIIIIIIEHKVSFHSIFFLFYIFSASQLIVNCCVNNTTFATSFQSTQTFRCRRPFWAFENMSPHLCTCGPYFAVAPITFDVIIILVVVAKTLKRGYMSPTLWAMAHPKIRKDTLCKTNYSSILNISY